ncbi:MAG: selenocysteine-specific translation elongation factor, partial [Comamonadaceae bacterium]
MPSWVAGASGIDAALLLIAADDGVMPQTIEHLTILSLLGIRRGAALVTKLDRVEPVLVEQRIAEARALLAGAGLGDWDVLAVSAQRGDGMEALRAWLLREAARAETGPGPGTAGFRMGLDRAFTLGGIGTVVAGSVAAGTVRIGDALCLADAPGKTFRVRSLHVNSQGADSAGAGRCAVGLAGLERSGVARGQTLCDPAIANQGTRIDVWLQLASTETAALRSGTLVHLHVSTQECMATVAVLGQPSVTPGGAALVQLIARQPVQLWQGDRVVLRDASASRTVAGGLVLDTAAPARYRQTPERLAWLQTQRSPDVMARLVGALAHSPGGIDGAQWLRNAGLLAWPFDLAAVDAVSDSAGQWLIGKPQLAVQERAVLEALQAFHERLPEDMGPDLQRARRLAAPRMPEGLWARLVDR